MAYLHLDKFVPNESVLFSSDSMLQNKLKGDILAVIDSCVNYSRKGLFGF